MFSGSCINNKLLSLLLVKETQLRTRGVFKENSDGQINDRNETFLGFYSIAAYSCYIGKKKRQFQSSKFQAPSVSVLTINLSVNHHFFPLLP